MTPIDWSIVGLYLVAAIGIGAWFTRRASRSTSDFFVAGRSLGWAVAGTSIVATTFSADTPVFVAGMSRTEGISANWFWWSLAIGQVATAFLFARYWRRSEVLTDVEFVRFRYGPGVATAVLRVFKAFFDGVGVNCVVMASVTLAMAKIISVVMGLDDTVLFTIPGVVAVDETWIVLLVLGGIALLYSSLSGLYGVVYTDIIQFVLAMVGSISLAVIAYVDASRGAGLLSNLEAAPDYQSSLLQFFPRFDEFSLPLFTFLVYIVVYWWSVAPGRGYGIQRLLATRSERDAKLAFLWYAMCHYVLRPWPWIVVGVLSMIWFPGLEDAEQAFPLMIDRFLPVGLKGIMVAAMLAAFMSTLDTHLNWGASYLVNDVYQPYLRPGHDGRHYVRVSRIAMVFLTIAALLATTRIPSILEAYKFLGVFVSGIGTVMIARWFWWRVNAISEIVAVAATCLIAVLALLFLPDVVHDDGTRDNLFGVRVLVATLGVAACWIPVALFSSPAPNKHVADFHRAMRIGGPGWRRVAEITGEPGESGGLARAVVGWILCTTLIFSVLLGSGKLIFHEWIAGGILMGAAGVTACLLGLLVRRGRRTLDG